MNINAGNGTDNFPNIFGKGILNVETDSMERSKDGYVLDEWETYAIPEINTGDLIYADVFDGRIESLKVGDVIVFAGKIRGNNALITHRIVHIYQSYVATQGDKVISLFGEEKKYDANDKDKCVELAGDMIDGNADNPAQLVSVDSIRGVVTGVNRGAGYALSNIRQNWLFYFVLPIAAILLIEIVFVVKNFLDLRHEKNKASLQDDKEAMMAELEAEKEKMRQELLAELRAQQAQEATEQVAEAAEAKDIEERVEEKEEVEEAPTEEVEENEEPTEATDEE